jgi:7-keto-8-aminopelargonate synthetase-like enzyme
MLPMSENFEKETCGAGFFYRFNIMVRSSIFFMATTTKSSASSAGFDTTSQKQMQYIITY